jgi:hypothetical protein
MPVPFSPENDGWDPLVCIYIYYVILARPPFPCPVAAGRRLAMPQCPTRRFRPGKKRALFFSHIYYIILHYIYAA